MPPYIKLLGPTFIPSKHVTAYCTTPLKGSSASSFLGSIRACPHPEAIDQGIVSIYLPCAALPVAGVWSGGKGEKNKLDAESDECVSKVEDMVSSIVLLAQVTP